MVQCLVGLGSNLGDRAFHLQEAWRQVAAIGGVAVLSLSRFHATSPAGGPGGQGDFLNAAGLLETAMPAESLLAELHRIELALGRVRHEHWGPRTIDLDLLLYGQQEICTSDLTVPHPRMAYRRFVLAPAAEIAPAMIYPINGWTLAALRDHLDRAPHSVEIASTGSVDVAAVVQRVRLVRDARIAEGWSEDGRTDQSSSAFGLDRPAANLVVLVDDPNDSAADSAACRQRWRRLMRQPHVGPVLWLRTAAEDAVVGEVVAAIDAMR